MQINTFCQRRSIADSMALLLLLKGGLLSWMLFMTYFWLNRPHGGVNILRFYTTVFSTFFAKKELQSLLLLWRKKVYATENYVILILRNFFKVVSTPLTHFLNFSILKLICQSWQHCVLSAAHITFFWSVFKKKMCSVFKGTFIWFLKLW